jgi:hypothetical protein
MSDHHDDGGDKTNHAVCDQAEQEQGHHQFPARTFCRGLCWVDVGWGDPGILWKWVEPHGESDSGAASETSRMPALAQAARTSTIR